jgi:hypothetical protein
MDIVSKQELKMSKLLISTQVYENYGDTVKPYWKPKGGSDYVVKKFRDFNRVTEVVMALRSQIEQDNEFYQESIIGWEVVADDYLTEFERDQLEYEGRVVYPAKELVVA